jgi:hypothetical protein
MNSSRLVARSPRKSSASGPSFAEASPELRWIHDGVRHRVTVWPEVSFQQERGVEAWEETELSEAALASAALGVTANQWRRYLDFVPAAEREFLAGFQFNRIGALLVLVRCPELVDELRSVPALLSFLVAHRSLRGEASARWAEISAVFDREGVFGVLQWLGLPASRQTLRILGNIADPDLPRRLLEPLRAALWEPEAIWALAHAEKLTDERIAAACHALAA